jgi:hypothetical protein
MLLADGRNSSVSFSVMQSYCPTGFYIYNASSLEPLECRACFRDKSATLYDNQRGIQSCVCTAGHYGTFGDACLPCPKNVEGFNCSLPNQTQPRILPGYYIQYSKMVKCSEYGPKCAAIIKCPNPNACPGQTEMQCVQSVKECYDPASFGCTACCYRYYMENLKCLPCPASQLILVLALATVGLILFAIFSSSFDFPPFVSAAMSLKVFMSGMQGFVAVRLIDIPWPPIVFSMFDFTRFFTFNFDVIRPECTVDYSPAAKLVFVLIGPFLCSFFIVLMIVAYCIFKCRRMATILQDKRVFEIIGRSYSELAVSVAQCLVTSSLCLKFSNARMMRDGALWNALEPTLVLRSDTLLLRQKLRRQGVATQQQPANDISSAGGAKVLSIPEDWIQMKKIVADLKIESEFARCAKRFRLLLASALSIFIFTFQGSVETALSTFDCKDVNGLSFLRFNPKVQCSYDDDLYPRMLAITVVGLLIYCLLLPCSTMVLLRSSWCRDVYLHDRMAYSQIFGFLNSMYCKSCKLWELVACVRKVAYVVIPILASRQTLAQSVSIFMFLTCYTFSILKVQPMASDTLNKIEALSCISVIFGSFSSIFFVVEYNGQPVLAGSSRDLAGIALVTSCGFCALLSLQLIRSDFQSKRTLF